MKFRKFFNISDDSSVGYRVPQSIYFVNEILHIYHYHLQQGALYPLLYRMEANGYISGHQQTVETKFGRS